MDEVNLNDPLNWYISDAMDEYSGHVDSGGGEENGRAKSCVPEAFASRQRRCRSSRGNRP